MVREGENIKQGSVWLKFELAHRVIFAPHTALAQQVLPFQGGVILEGSVCVCACVHVCVCVCAHVCVGCVYYTCGLCILHMYICVDCVYYTCTSE